MRRIVFDTETTGISVRERHRVIEIGCVETIDFQKTGETFHMLLNPEREIDAMATKVHGKTLEMLRNKPKFAEIAEDFLLFVKDTELIAHNAPFDVGFINYELSLIGMPSILNEITDTLMIARKKFPGKPASLDELCKRFLIDNSSREFHGALLDADLLADVFLRMCKGDDIAGDLDYKIKNQRLSPIKRTTSFPIRKFEISEEELAKHKEFLRELGF